MTDRERLTAVARRILGLVVQHTSGAYFSIHSAPSIQNWVGETHAIDAAAVAILEEEFGNRACEEPDIWQDVYSDNPLEAVSVTTEDRT